MTDLPPEAISRITSRLGRELEEWLRDRTVEPHYSAERCAELLDVSVRTIWNYIEAGERSQGREGIWPVVKLSHKVVRIPASALNRYLRSRTIAVPAPMESPL